MHGESLSSQSPMTPPPRRGRSHASIAANPMDTLVTVHCSASFLISNGFTTWCKSTSNFTCGTRLEMSERWSRSGTPPGCLPAPSWLSLRLPGCRYFPLHPFERGKRRFTHQLTHIEQHATF